MNIDEITQELKTGQVNPPRLAEMKDWLAGESSTIMDRQLELQQDYARFYSLKREGVKSDKAVKMLWQALPDGIEEMILETRQKKIKVLREAISSHLRVAEGVARNMY